MMLIEIFDFIKTQKEFDKLQARYKRDMRELEKITPEVHRKRNLKTLTEDEEKRYKYLSESTTYLFHVLKVWELQSSLNAYKRSFRKFIQLSDPVNYTNAIAAIQPGRSQKRGFRLTDKVFKIERSMIESEFEALKTNCKEFAKFDRQSIFPTPEQIAFHKMYGTKKPG